MSKLSKEDYRPISILPYNLRFARFAGTIISVYFKNNFSKKQRSYRKCYRAEYCLLAIIDKPGVSTQLHQANVI